MISCVRMSHLSLVSGVVRAYNPNEDNETKIGLPGRPMETS